MIKRLFTFALLLVASVLAHAQANTVTIQFPGVPTGSCAFIMYGLNAAQLGHVFAGLKPRDLGLV